MDPEKIWKNVENHRLNVPKKKRPPGSSLTLSDRLYDCYVDCMQNANDKNFDKRFRNAVNLLHQLPPDHVQASLVVSLYSDERGYSLSLTPGQGRDIFLPYEDNEIFSYLDNQEIPPILMEVLAKTKHCHTWSGCVVCEVRNYRHPSPPSPYESHLLMLRPTTETILQMVNEIATDSNCSPEEQLMLESKLLLATQPPICLDPSTEVVWVTNRLHYNRRKFHSPSMRRYLRRRSQARRARMGHVAKCPAPPELQLHDFLVRQTSSLKCPQPKSANLWKRSEVALTVPNPDLIARSIHKHAKVLKEVVPVATPTTTPTEVAQPPSPTTSPAPHIRTQGRKLAEELLQGAVGGAKGGDKGRRQPQLPPKSSPMPAPPLPLPQAAQPPSSLPFPPLHPHPSPALASIPTPAAPTPTVPPPALTPHSQPPPPPPPLPTTTLPLAPQQPSQVTTSSIPTSLPSFLEMYKTIHALNVKRPRPIAPAPSSSAPMFVIATKPVTSQIAPAGRSIPGVVTQVSQPLVARAAQQPVAKRPVMPTPPKLQRPPPLPPLTNPPQPGITSMPKLHRITAPPPPILPSPSLPHSTTITATKTTPLMPQLHRLAHSSSTHSLPSMATVSKATLPTLKASPYVSKVQPPKASKH